MDSIDKLLPLLILGVLGAILLVLLRRTAREKPTVSARAVAPKPVAAEVAPTQDRQVPVALVKDACEAEAAPSAAVKRKAKGKEMLPTPAPPASTIAAVLGLLQNQQTLATAFVLREVFAPPVSRRPRLPRDR
jgi:hypothetical protein